MDISQTKDSIKHVFKNLGDGTFAEKVFIVSDPQNRANVEVLGVPVVSRTLAATSTSSNQALTSTCTRISIYARTADIRYVVGVGSQTALPTSHFIAQNERLDIAVLPGSHIAVIRDGSTNGSIEITELS